MLNLVSGYDQIYLVCGYTDLRKGIDGLNTLVSNTFNLNPFQNILFLFCGRRTDRIKALLWEGDGFVILYKRLENGNYQWPRTEHAARQLSAQELRWLLEGLTIDPKKRIEPSHAKRVL